MSVVCGFFYLRNYNSISKFLPDPTFEPDACTYAASKYMATVNHTEKIQLNNRKNGLDSNEEENVSAKNRGIGTILMKGATSLGRAFSNWGATNYPQYYQQKDARLRTQLQKEVNDTTSVPSTSKYNLT